MTSDGSPNTSTSRRHPSIGRRVQPDDTDFTSSSHSLLNGSRQLAQQHNKQHPTRSRCKGRMAHDTPAWMKQKTSFAESSWPTSPSASCGHCGWTLWFRRVYTSLQLRRRLCVSYVVPVLMYTIGTREEQNIFTWMSTVIVVYARSSAAIGLFVYRTRHCTTDADANHERWRHNSKIEPIWTRASHAVQQAIDNVPGPTASISADGVERRPASRMSYVVCYVAASTSTRNCHIRKPISDTLTLLGNRSTLQTPLFYHWGGYKHSESRWVK